MEWVALRALEALQVKNAVKHSLVCLVDDGMEEGRQPLDGVQPLECDCDGWSLVVAVGRNH